MTQTDSPHFAPSSSTATNALPTSSRRRASPCRGLVDLELPPSRWRPSRTIAMQHQPDRLIGRVRVQTLGAQPCFLGARQPHCQKPTRGTRSCAGWFPPWERSAVGRRYRTPFLARSSIPSWPSNSGTNPIGQRTRRYSQQALAGKSELHQTESRRPTVSVFAANNAKLRVAWFTTRVKWITRFPE